MLAGFHHTGTLEVFYSFMVRPHNPRRPYNEPLLWFMIGNMKYNIVFPKGRGCKENVRG